MDKSGGCKSHKRQLDYEWVVAGDLATEKLRKKRVKTEMILILAYAKF